MEVMVDMVGVETGMGGKLEVTEEAALEVDESGSFGNPGTIP